VDVDVTRFAPPQDRYQFALKPKIPEIKKRWADDGGGGPNVPSRPLSTERLIEVSGEIL